MSIHSSTSTVHGTKNLQEDSHSLRNLSDEDDIGTRSVEAKNDPSCRIRNDPAVHVMGAEKPTEEKQVEESEAFVVKWDKNDPENPMNWSATKKSWITFQLGMIALAGSLGSSITAPAEDAIAEEVGVSSEAAVLCVSLYVLGFALGAPIWAPISEVWGRKVSMLPPMVCLSLFSIGVAVSQNAASIFICRFFSGLFGSAPVSNVGAALGDIWHPRVRGTAVSIYAVCVVGGPTIGPLIGAALTNNPHLGWRWTGYMLAIWTGVVVLLLLAQFPEVYGPCLLKRKAQRLRKETGDDRWWHPHEKIKVDPKTIVTKYFTRPLHMLIVEPMVTCIATYAAFAYALLYMTLQVFPIVYQEHRQWGIVVSTLPFLAIFVGVVGALGINLTNQPRVARIVDANGGNPVPESRLQPMAVGGVLFVIGLFWFGWTADPPVHWASSVVAAGFIGAGCNIVLQQCINFLVDTYQLYAASAVATSTILRSLLGAALPLATAPMFHNLGVGPAMSILGGCAALALPVPFLFMRYGLTLRRMSKFAPVND